MKVIYVYQSIVSKKHEETSVVHVCGRIGNKYFGTSDKNCLYDKVGGI